MIDKGLVKEEFSRQTCHDKRQFQSMYKNVFLNYTQTHAVSFIILEAYQKYFFVGFIYNILFVSWKTALSIDNIYTAMYAGFWSSNPQCLEFHFNILKVFMNK